MEKPSSGKRKLTWLVVLLTLLAIIVILYVMYTTGFLALFTDQTVLRAYIAQFGFWAPAIFFVLQILQVIFSVIPGNVTTAVGSALFGFWPGILLSFSAITIGSMLAFGLARLIGKAAVRNMVGHKWFDKYTELMQSQVSRERVLLALMMLLPFFPDDLICLLAGLTGIPFWSFFLISLFTRPWGLVFSALLGAGAFSLPTWALVIIGVVSIGLGALAVRFAPQLEQTATRVALWVASKIKPRHN